MLPSIVTYICLVDCFFTHIQAQSLGHADIDTNDREYSQPHCSACYKTLLKLRPHRLLQSILLPMAILLILPSKKKITFNRWIFVSISCLFSCWSEFIMVIWFVNPNKFNCVIRRVYKCDWPRRSLIRWWPKSVKIIDSTWATPLSKDADKALEYCTSVLTFCTSIYSLLVIYSVYFFFSAFDYLFSNPNCHYNS